MKINFIKLKTLVMAQQKPQLAGGCEFIRTLNELYVNEFAPTKTR